MFSICPSSSSNSIFTPLHSIPHFNSHPLFVHHLHKRRFFTSPTKFVVKNPHLCNSILFFRNKISGFCFSNNLKASQLINSSVIEKKDLKDGVFSSISKSVALALFWVVIGLCPVSGFQPHAIALPAISDILWRKKGKIVKEEPPLVSWKEHEFSGYTQRLLDCVSDVLKVMKEVRVGESGVKELEDALERVKLKKKELQKEIMGGLHAELKVLKENKQKLGVRAREVFRDVMKAKNVQDTLLDELRITRGNDPWTEGDKEKLNRAVESLDSVEKDYNELQDMIGEIEDLISKRETLCLSIGVSELMFIEDECEGLVRRFIRETRHNASLQENSSVPCSRNDIQKDLEAAQREHIKQMILPGVVEYDDALGPLFDGEQMKFVQRVKQALQESKNLQRELEGRIRKDMKKHGKETRFIQKTPEGDIIKGFPEAELKWMFGNKEVVVPKAVNIYLLDGWKRWREDAKEKLKKSVLEDVNYGKQYVSKRQERIILDRDRVVSKTFYNEEKSRWEIDPVAVPYAVSKNLVQYARIRHDGGVMYIGLKGEDKEYYVDLKVYELLFEDLGGFDELYLKMIASGVPTAVRLMWIPLSELNIYQQAVLVAKLFHGLLDDLWNEQKISFGRKFLWNEIKYTTADLFTVVVFPIVEFLIPYQVRVWLGMAWPEEIDQTVGSTWYLEWQSAAESSFKLRKRDTFRYYALFLVKGVIYCFILYHTIRFLKRKAPRWLGFGPYRRDPNFQKLRRLTWYFKYKKHRILSKRRAGIDPIRTVFDNMKRVKNPPIRLHDFASIESMKEEINEVVAFLQNPSAFQKLGARAPRGVLIVGERGTGKTSLALAIAAEARVPLVEVKAQQLEAGLWVGQSASNVRELFQTARDLAPVIIFVEDFDQFAGVRGKFIHTKKQDHEAFINQMLVELDGFEKQDGVVLMATTRNLKQIDQALCRPGRMDRIFNLQRPTQAEREKILRTAAKGTMDPEVVEFVDWRKVAEKTTLLRPIELKLVPVALEGSAFRNKILDTDELLSYCSWIATFSAFVPNWLRKTNLARRISNMVVNHLGLTLTRDDLRDVVDQMEPYGQITNGIEFYSPPLDWTRDTKFPHAVWAAGRGLIALLLPNFDAVDNIWLEPLAWEGIGCTKITKAKNEGSMDENVETLSYLEKKLVFLFGSHVASQLLLPFGEENLLSASELKQAQEIATRMVIQYGWGPDGSPTIYYHGNAATALSMGNKHEFEMAAKVEKMFYLAYDKAKDMLQKNRPVLENIVDELLEFEILTGKDLERIIESNGGIKEKEPFSLSRVYENDSSSARYLDDGDSAPVTALLGAAT
ncbi:probable inactive ATP-dependent zinc metalloprotease FTSHI 5, chloroplastic isoform X2 [Amaranthus tricolor]|uniref:probable inactive ATP-dependent zinc metalloprotease FTSHI 5, chloroplastic isoform X2 n=1 Tax=Amaranthus tricolor TaxID=29722 RepID=UPI00258D4DE0|nr:probable inactive ATP-dependent zinc metalloprotease FTSHI 5, chloroplastic isoform X2 [Amaranthus tricolor]